MINKIKKTKVMNTKIMNTKTMNTKTMNTKTMNTKTMERTNGTNVQSDPQTTACAHARGKNSYQIVSINTIFNEYIASQYLQQSIR